MGVIGNRSLNWIEDKRMNILHLDKQGFRRFGFVMALFIALIFGLFLPWLAGTQTMPLWPWVFSACFIVWSLVWPMGLKFVYKPWMYLGHYLGIVNTKIILGLIFYLVFTPVALFFKLFGRDPMERRWKKETGASYWKPSNKQPRKHMENPY